MLVTSSYDVAGMSANNSIIYTNLSPSYLEKGGGCPVCQGKENGGHSEEHPRQSVSAPTPLASPVQKIPGGAVVVKPGIPLKAGDAGEDSSRQWQSKPGKHGGRLLKGRSGAPGKKPVLTNPAALTPSERNLEAESQIRDIQSALLLWQRDATRGRSLSDRAVMVYQFFITHCRRDPRKEGYLKCWHTVGRIAVSLCMGKRTVERAIAELKKARCLLGERERYANGEFGPRYFWILTPPDLTKYALKPANTPNRHITVEPDGAPNRHITVEPDGALLEERRFKQTSKKAEAGKPRSGANPAASSISRPAAPHPHVRDHGQTTAAGADGMEERIQRLQQRLRFFLSELIPEDHELYAWSMDPEHVQDAVREVSSGVLNGVSPRKSLLNLRRKIQVKPRDEVQRVDLACRNIFPDHTHLPNDPTPGVSEPTCPICRGKRQLTEMDSALVDVSHMGRVERRNAEVGAVKVGGMAPAQSSPQRTKKELRREVVAERASRRIEVHQYHLRQILDPVLAKGHALYAWSMDPEHVSNALRAVSRGMERGESPVTALGILARNGDYMSRTDQILGCRVVLGRARNNATEPCPISWEGKESWMDHVIQEAPELVYERFMKKKAALSPGRDLYRGAVIRICVSVRETMREERKMVTPMNHAALEVEYV